MEKRGGPRAGGRQERTEHPSLAFSQVGLVFAEQTGEG